MVDFLVLVWLLSLVGVVLGAINLFKAKRKGKTKFTSKQAKTILITSIVISFISFISIGVLTPSVEKTPNNTVTLNSIENQELMREYQIFGPPVLLIYNKGELKSQITGLISSDELLKSLSQI